MSILILVHQNCSFFQRRWRPPRMGKERSFKFRSCIDGDFEHTRTFDLKSQLQPLTSSQRFCFTHEGKCQVFAFSEGAGCYFSWQAWAQQLETRSQVREADKVATTAPEARRKLKQLFFSFLNGVAKEKTGAYLCNFTVWNKMYALTHTLLEEINAVSD